MRIPQNPFGFGYQSSSYGEGGGYDDAVRWIIMDRFGETRAFYRNPVVNWDIGRKGSASHSEIHFSTSMDNCSLPLTARSATSHALIDEMKTHPSPAALSIVLRADSDRRCGSLIHQTHACVSKTINQAPPSLPPPPAPLGLHTSERSRANDSLPPKGPSDMG